MQFAYNRAVLLPLSRKWYNGVLTMDGSNILAWRIFFGVLLAFALATVLGAMTYAFLG